MLISITALVREETLIRGFLVIQMQKIFFNGTILDFLAFLQSYITRHNFPGFSSRSPHFFVIDQEIDSISENTRLVKFHVWPHLYSGEILELIVSSLPKKRLLITVTALRNPQWTQVYFERAYVKSLWESIVFELSEQGWLSDTVSLTTPEYDVKYLKSILQERLSISDIRDLCFELDIEYENLEDQTLRGSIRELIIKIRKMGQIPRLIDACNKIRPDLEL